MTNYDDEYLKYLRAIIEQARREKWNSQETSMAIQQLQFTLAMKYNEPTNMDKRSVSDG